MRAATDLSAIDCFSPARHSTGIQTVLRRDGYRPDENTRYVHIDWLFGDDAVDWNR
ncbi:hypothetical protein Mame01_68810 [Microbispora amethystogenes]|nr:hypothetical protein Mame01_68810 [Microbispora amethystogenes]